ncbi:MAG: FIST C-terminal domain-containing protein [Gammaproteobacteria bacterium]|nr:FIST C-terminal domain-containing protein [Gammaproteobacteria bacterium]
MISVGYSAAVETSAAVREALQAASVDDSTSWLLVFAGRRHGADRLLSQIREQAGDIPVYGGSCVGAISSTASGYSGNEIVIAAFSSEAGAPRVCIAEPLEQNEADAGRQLAEWLEQEEVSAAMLFYDVTRRGGGINVGTSLIDGIYDSLKEGMEPQLFGAGLLGDFPLTESHVFVGDGCRKNVALAVAVPPGLRTEPRVMHGCAPVSGFMTVTRADAARIYELDGAPAAQVLRSMAGSDDVALAFSILLGRRSSNLHAPFQEADFMNRLIIDVNEDDGSVGLFETDIRTGDRVQVMMRDNQLLMESVKKGVEESLGKLDGRNAELAFYVDCAGRASVFTGSEEEEARKLAEALGPDIPLLGFYAGREIAPFDGRSRPLDWTGVLVMFTRTEAA